MHFYRCTRFNTNVPMFGYNKQKIIESEFQQSPQFYELNKNKNIIL